MYEKCKIILYQLYGKDKECNKNKVYVDVVRCIRSKLGDQIFGIFSCWKAWALTTLYFLVSSMIPLGLNHFVFYTFILLRARLDHKERAIATEIYLER